MDTNSNWTTEFNLTKLEYQYILASPLIIILPSILIDVYVHFNEILTRKNRNRYEWNIWIVLKILLTLNCIGIKLYDIVTNYGGEFIQINSLICCGVCLSLIKQILNHLNGVQSCVILFSYWFWNTLVHLPEFLFNYNLLQKIPQNIFLAMSVVICGFNLMGPFTTTGKSNSIPVVGDTNLNFLSSLTYHWFSRVAHQISRSDNTMPEKSLDPILWDLSRDNSSEIVFRTFERHYRSGTSLTRALIKTFGKTFLTTTIMRLSNMLLFFVCPLLLKCLILFASANQPHWVGLTYTALLVLISIVITFLSMKHLERTFVIAMKVQSTIMNLIYRKIMKISAANKTKVGIIINLITTDIQGFPILVPMLNMLWSGMLIILITIYFLFLEFGHAVWPGVFVMFLNLIVINFFIGRRIKKCDIKQKERKDKRINLITEILNSVKVLKLNTWENHFQRIVERIRQDEIKILKWMEIYNSSRFFCTIMTPFIGSLATFAAYTYLDRDGDNVLTVAKAFVALALFNIIQYPLQLVAVLKMNLIQTKVSIKRIEEFLKTPEKNDIVFEKDFEGNPNSIVAENATIFCTGNESRVLLKDVNMKIPKGSLVAVIGNVGCGKSSLLSAIIDDAEFVEGRILRYGSISYVPQQPWLFQDTIENNILFGKVKDNQLYYKVLGLCCLIDDLEKLPHHDQTQINERGVNLSGGQKQRICLARSIYSGSATYLFDDPFTAVDHQVGKRIFDKVFSRNGFLASKTRIFVTSSLKFLSDVDYVINVGDDGRVVFDSFENCQSSFEYLLNENLAKVDEIIVEAVPVINVEMRNLVDKKSLEIIQNDRNGNKNLIPLIPMKEIPKNKPTINKISRQSYFKYINLIGYALCFWVILFQVCGQFCSVYTNIILSEWADRKTNDTHINHIYLTQYGLYGLGQAVLFFLSCLLLSLFGCLKVAQKLHKNYLKHLLKLPMAFFSANPSSGILQRFSQDINSLDSILPAAIREWVQVCITLLSVLIFLSLKKYLFAVVMLFFYGVYIYLSCIYLNVSRKLKHNENNSKAPICAHFTDTIVGGSILKTSNMEERFTRNLAEKINYHQKFTYFHIISLRWLGVRLEFLGTAVTFLVAILMIYTNETAVNVALCMNYCFQIIQYLNQLNRTTTMIEGNIVAVERIDEYLKKDTEPNGIAKPEIQTNTENDQIELRNVFVQYGDDKPSVLKNISFTVKRGEKIGVIGRTGSGKSTLVSALIRLINPSAGEILLENTDIQSIDLKYLRQNIAMVPQEITLFSGTLRSNLDPLNLCKNDDEIWQILSDINMKSTIRELDGQLNYAMKSNGDNLSLGQKQLLNLARVLLRCPKILILDEITSNIDLETENQIIRTLNEKYSDCTIIIISHRLQSVMNCDKILVLENGEMLEFDKRTTLLEDKNSTFYNLILESGLLKT